MKTAILLSYTGIGIQLHFSRVTGIEEKSSLTPDTEGDKIVLVDTALLLLVKSPLIVTVDSMLSGVHPILSQDDPLNICHW